MSSNISIKASERPRRSWALSGISTGLLWATTLAALMLAGLSGFAGD
ncbi:hypothetical protein [Sedimenticola sp.]